MNEMNGNFPWSPSGIHCLKSIQSTIENEGGIEKFTEIIIEELEGNSYKCEMRTLKDKIRLMYGKVYCKDIPVILGMSQCMFRSILDEMELTGTSAGNGQHKTRAIHFLKKEV